MTMLIKDDSKQCLSIFNGAFANPLLIERLVLTIYAVIFFIGLVGNIMTIVIIKYNAYLRTPTNFYLLNLAVSDLMMLLCNLPLEMIEIYYRQWPLPVAFCKLRSLCAEFFTCSSILTILAFTCERYFAIVHPIHFHQLSHFRRAQNIIIIIWCISLAFSLPLGLSFEIESTTSTLSTSQYTSNRTRSAPLNDSYSLLSNYCNACVPNKSVAKLWSIIMIITSLCFFYLPMLIIGAIYLFIGQALRRANEYENHVEEAEPSLSSISSNGMTLRRGVTSIPYQSDTIATESIEMKPAGTHVGSYSWLKTRARCQARQVVVKTLGKQTWADRQGEKKATSGCFSFSSGCGHRLLLLLCSTLSATLTLSDYGSQLEAQLGIRSLFQDHGLSLCDIRRDVLFRISDQSSALQRGF